MCQGVSNVTGSRVSGCVWRHGFSCVRVCLTSRVLVCQRVSDVIRFSCVRVCLASRVRIPGWMRVHMHASIPGLVQECRVKSHVCLKLVKFVGNVNLMK